MSGGARVRLCRPLWQISMFAQDCSGLTMLYWKNCNGVSFHFQKCPDLDNKFQEYAKNRAHVKEFGLYSKYSGMQSSSSFCFSKSIRLLQLFQILSSSYSLVCSPRSSQKILPALAARSTSLKELIKAQSCLFLSHMMFPTRLLLSKLDF